MHQNWSAVEYERNARFVSELGAEILAWLKPRVGERVLDLGCGDGALTQKIAAAGADVIGVDTSSDFLRTARKRGLDVRHMNAQALTFDAEFDAVFSNAALHWMTEPKAVLRGVAAALKPGGRFVAEFGGHGNVAAIVTALRSAAFAFGGDASLAHPWFFPTVQEYTELLDEAGFIAERIGLHPRSTQLPTGMEGWLMTFRKPFFDQFPEAERKAAHSHTIELLRPSLCDKSENWTADYVRLRVAARLRP